MHDFEHELRLGGQGCLAHVKIYLWFEFMFSDSLEFV